MNQTKKRLTIIKLAISINDLETIKLQTLKLRLIKTDTKLQEIINIIYEENYFQAQQLIEEYIDTPTEEIIQRSKQNEIEEIEDKEIEIDNSQFFETQNQGNKDINLNDFLDYEPTKIKDVKEIDFDTLLNIDSDDVLKDNIDLNIDFPTEDKDLNQNNQLNNLLETDIPKDTFFDEESTIDNQYELPYDTSICKYDPKPYIRQKLNNMNNDYPPIIIDNQRFIVLEELLDRLSEESYTEREIEIELEDIPKLIEDSRYYEASQLLLICASTESKFAQLMLARELYKGAIFQQNIEEAFNIIYSLAMDDYPEALCDLGQFYEYGIATTKNIDKATSLYKEAMGYDIKRAEKHFNRVKKSKGLFGRFFK